MLLSWGKKKRLVGQDGVKLIVIISSIATVLVL
jgi:hypothetical protein